MAKILGVVASRRKGGNSEVLVREALLGARDAGATVEIVRLSDLVLKPCRGCLSCVYKGRCAITDDDFGELLTKLLAVDGLILAAPTYLLSPAGIVKLVADRGLNLTPHLDRIDLDKRKAVTISVAGREDWNPLGTALLGQAAWIFGFQVINSLEAYSPGPAEILLNEEVTRRAFSAGWSVAEATVKNYGPRAPQINQCPVCFGKAVNIDPDGRVTCASCLTPGYLTGVDGQPRIEFTPDPDRHFFSPAGRKFHVQEWIVPSKDKFRRKLPGIKEASTSRQQAWDSIPEWKPAREA